MSPRHPAGLDDENVTQTLRGKESSPLTKESHMNEELEVRSATEALENQAPALDDFSIVEVDEVPAALIQYSSGFCA
jgi:hypothetical protein